MCAGPCVMSRICRAGSLTLNRPWTAVAGPGRVNFVTLFVTFFGHCAATLEAIKEVCGGLAPRVTCGS